jgi:hypothetical protein
MTGELHERHEQGIARRARTIAPGTEGDARRQNRQQGQRGIQPRRCMRRDGDIAHQNPQGMRARDVAQQGERRAGERRERQGIDQHGAGSPFVSRALVVRDQHLHPAIDGKQQRHEHREQRGGNACAGECGVAQVANDGNADQAHHRLGQKHERNRRCQAEDDAGAMAIGKHQFGRQMRPV